MGDSNRQYASKERDRAEALRVLRAELREFSHDGLVQLRSDLAKHAVVRGTWAGCALSYRCGSPGSSRRDRRGAARNAFTIFWDHGWLTDAEVGREVGKELAQRAGRVEAPAPALTVGGGV